MKKNDDVQYDDKREEEAEQERSNFCVRRHRGNSLADGGVIEREPHPEHEVRKTGAVVGETDGPVPAEEIE